MTQKHRRHSERGGGDLVACGSLHRVGGSRGHLRERAQAVSAFPAASRHIRGSHSLSSAAADDDIEASTVVWDVAPWGCGACVGLAPCRE